MHPSNGYRGQPSNGQARQGKARQGKAKQSKAKQSKARQASNQTNKLSELGVPGAEIVSTPVGPCCLLGVGPPNAI